MTGQDQSRIQKMAVRSEQCLALATLLKTKNNVEEELFDYVIDTIGCKAVSDFAGFFEARTYADAVQTEILDHIDKFKADRIQRSRLRVAWEMAKAETAQALTQSAGTSTQSIDWEKPLDPEERVQQEKTFEAAYHITFPPETTPSEALYTRHYKEFRRHCKSVDNLVKVRSAAQFGTTMSSETKKQVAPGVELNFKDKEDIPDANFQMPLEVIVALEILTNSWAMTGTMLVDSKADKGTKVREADLSECIAYRVFVQEKALTYNGSPAQTTSWLLDRDRQTRSQARQLYLKGWPWGEALREAREKHVAVLWTVGSISAGSRPETVLPLAVAPGEQDQRSARDRTPRRTKKDRPDPKFCQDFNSQKGCSRRQQDCPKGLTHKCNFATPSGECGAWQHGRQNCPHNQDRVKSKKQERKGQSRGRGGSKSGGF